MKNSPKKADKFQDKNLKRIQDQQKKQNAVKKGNPASSTPQGAGIGNGTQATLDAPSPADLKDLLNVGFDPIDPEAERESAAKTQKGKTAKKKSLPANAKNQGSKKLENTKRDSKQIDTAHGPWDDPAHWEGEGEPGYASHDPHQTRQWLEKE